MKRKKIFLIILCLICIIIGIFIFISTKENKDINEIMPEEEISTQQERKAMVSLYFRNKMSKDIEPEIRLVDVKDLVEDPYNTIIDLLLEGPKKESLEKTIPEGTKVLKIYSEGDTIIIDFSKEFIENHPMGEEIEKSTIESIVKTFTELTEIDSAEILIEGEKNVGFNDNNVIFNQKFIREE